MPLINLKIMPKSKQKLIKLQVLIFGVIILFPIICFGTYFTFKATIWKGSSNQSQSQIKSSSIKTIKSNFNIEYDNSNNWVVSIQSSIGSKENKNRNLLFNYTNGSNSITFQVNELSITEPKAIFGQPFNGSQKTNFIEVSQDTISKAIVIYNDLAGQKIVRVENILTIENPQLPKSYILIDLNSKKLGEKDLNNKSPQPDKYFYNTRLNLMPELNNIYKDQDRVVVTEVKYTENTIDLNLLGEQIKKIKITD